MLKVIDITQTPPEVENPYKFPLDPFQKFAFDAINNHENVLVTAKTGSGKTIVGEYQIHTSLAKGKRVFYTTPIKSLSNQKFHDLKEVYGSVGIMTGDIKFAPQSEVVVMTTEILCNLLFKKDTPNEVFTNLTLSDVDAVIFDEVHYINDPDRGKVWEQCMMLLPKGINLVLLSATIATPEPFGQWLSEVRGTNVHLISTTYRIVPLLHIVGSEQTVMDSKDKFYPDIYRNWLKQLDIEKKKLKDHKEKVSDRRGNGYEDGPISRDVRDHSFLFQMNQKVREMQTKNLLPALFFSFSRTKCEEYAKKVEPDLLTSTETSAVKNIVEFYLHRYPHVIGSPQYHQLCTMLSKGIAFHHSGLIPMLKEIIEILFSRGLIKLLFATETFAVGINMPTKSVVFTSFNKRDEHGFRMLRTDEYIQMAGRAGRRGKDDKGFVFYLPDREPASVAEVQQMMTGRQMTVESKMDFDYNFILKSGENWKEIAEKSYWRAQHRKIIEGCNIQLEKLKVSMQKEEERISSIQSDECVVRSELELRVKNSVNVVKKDAQRSLEQWKNTHVGPVWKSVWEIYVGYRKISEEYFKLQQNTKNIEDYESEINMKIEFLKAFDFDNMPLSQLAANVHEGHVILMPLIFKNRLIHHLPVDKLIGCLALFIEGEDDDIMTTYHNNHEITKIKEIRDMLQNYEDASRIEPTKWKLDLYWVDIAVMWMNGISAPDICKEYAIYEGNFIRAMLKLANLAEEWQTMATITSDIQQLELLTDIRQKIVRDVVIPDSLYLRL
jgi:superfamily II RNA helicase